jgi:pantoate kinase
LSARVARAFAPGGISSFFEICDTAADGKPIADPERVGARGGGFVVQRGVTTEVSVSEAKASSVRVFINGRLALEAETTVTAAQTLLGKVNQANDVIVRHEVNVPIGAGFGSSAAGALSASLALSKALGLKLTYNQLGRIAHVAEIKCKTGLGTVGPLMLGGCILTVEPGAPGIAIIDRIPIPADCVIVAGAFEPIPTKPVLSSFEKREIVNRWGRKTLKAVLDEPSVENFLACCLEFAEKAGFMTERVRQLMRLAEKAGAIGAAQNMVGEAVHALAREENAGNIAEAFKQVLPNEKIIVARIDLQGARLVGHEEV